LSPVDCDEFLREIELYLDRELPEGACLEIEAHLSDCPPCLEHYEFRRKLQVLIARTCGREDVPERLIQRVRWAVRSELTED
jgi:mycothiol system anti-sigma-R factor